MINRFIEKLKDPQERKLFMAILGGKALGLALCLLLMFAASFYFSSASKVHAQTASPTAAETAASPSAASPAASPAAATAPAAAPAPNPPYVNPINTMWVLITAFLVFFMQAGFMFLEAGFARTREAINVMLEGVVDTCLCGILFYAWGFAWMFGHGNGFIGWGGPDGHPWYFLQHLPDTYESTGVATIAIFLFQFAFADTCSTITSGAMVGRTGFWGDLWYSIGVSGFIYPIFGHWAWGPDGWLNTIPFWKAPFHDFAGSTVVHTIGGTIALAGAIVLGPRLGRVFKRDGGGPMPAHNMLIASVGAIILWFGWYGFNPGSTLSAMDYIGIARVATNTTLAACAGGLLALFYMYPRTKKWDCGMCLNGLLAGLVAITCPCYWVSPFGAIMIGAVAGVVVVWGTDLLEWLRIDDPCGDWPVRCFDANRRRHIVCRQRAILRRWNRSTGCSIHREHLDWRRSFRRSHGSHVCRKSHRHIAGLGGGRARGARSSRTRYGSVSGDGHRAQRPHPGPGGNGRCGLPDDSISLKGRAANLVVSSGHVHAHTANYLPGNGSGVRSACHSGPFF